MGLFRQCTVIGLGEIQKRRSVATFYRFNSLTATDRIPCMIVPILQLNVIYIYMQESYITQYVQFFYYKRFILRELRIVGSVRSLTSSCKS